MADPIISPEARADLDDTWAYLAQHSLDAADRFLDEFWDAAQRHARFPRTGRPRNDLRSGLRSFVVGRHVAFFTPEGDSIRIVRVLHGSQSSAAATKRTNSADKSGRYPSRDSCCDPLCNELPFSTAY
jgi:toxin ParE1/3/4